MTPGYQEVLSGIRLLMWLDSSQEQGKGQLLEDRVQQALDPARRAAITRFGGLSLGESTHLVDEVSHFEADDTQTGEHFLLAERGRMTLPVWVDHVGSAGTRYVTGDLVIRPLRPPELREMPQILPP